MEMNNINVIANGNTASATTATYFVSSNKNAHKVGMVKVVGNQVSAFKDKVFIPVKESITSEYNGGMLLEPQFSTNTGVICLVINAIADAVKNGNSAKIVVPSVYSYKLNSLHTAVATGNAPVDTNSDKYYLSASEQERKVYLEVMNRTVSALKEAKNANIRVVFKNPQDFAMTRLIEKYLPEKFGYFSGRPVVFEEDGTAGIVQGKSTNKEYTWKVFSELPVLAGVYSCKARKLDSGKYVLTVQLPTDVAEYRIGRQVISSLKTCLEEENLQMTLALAG